MKILVTGSNGLVAGNLLKSLDNKSDFLATARQKLYFDFPHFELLDLNNYAAVSYILDLYKPGVVINSAALAGVGYCQKNKEICFDVNYNAVVNLAEECRKRDIHLVHLSTDFVFDGRKGMYDENDIPSPVNYYGETKYRAEKYLLDSGVSCAIVRTVLVYGYPVHSNKGNIMTLIINSMKNNKPVKVVNDQFRTPTLVDDLSRALLTISNNKLDGIWHISGNEYLSVFNFACKIADYFGYSKELIYPVSSAGLNKDAMRPPKTGFEINKAVTQIDYHPHNILQGLSVLNNNN